MPKEDTKQRITMAALTLFNQQGTAAVSTNHIAEEAGVSPGNLYYHFRNKEEIIRDIFERMNVAWAQINTAPAGRGPTPGDLHRIIKATFELLHEYRFFYRESLALTRRDPVLAQRYRQVRETGLANTEILLGSFAASGFLRQPDDPTTLPNLARTIWLITEFWLPFAELGDESVEAGQLRTGLEVLTHVLHPYLTEDALTALGASRDHSTHHEVTS